MTERSERSKFDLRREATRESLIALGLERLPVRGYAATSIEDILRDSPHGRGGFYFHFTGKEDFFLAMLAHREQLRGSWWEFARDPALTTLEEVVAAGLVRIAEMMPPPNPWGLLVAEFWQVVKEDHQRVEQIREFYRGWQREITLFCEELVARDMLRTDIEPAACAEILHATVEGYTIHALVYGTDLDGLADTVVRVLRP